MINNVKLTKKGFAIKTIGKFGVANIQKTRAPVRRINIFFYLLQIIALLLLSYCAKPVSPTGGAKDITPPEVIACSPPELAAKFSENSFRIDFNEFFNLKNPATEVFISPPIKSPLNTRIRGKSLIIRFDDTLAANTTYSVSFGNAIADLTESNILKGFNYVFSTGDFVDSLSLQGTLHSAFDLKPQKDVFVGLYINNNDTLPFDSLPHKVAPYYITKTDDLGNFRFRNLRDEPFKLFALADQNGDLVFNQPSEKIAFYDSLVRPYYEKPTGNDTIRADSITYPSCPLYQFEETDSIQRILKATFPAEGMALLTFRFPVKNLRVVPLNFDSTAPWHLEEFLLRRDSVRLWITRPGTDSLVLKIIVDNKILDTVSLEYLKREKLKRASQNEIQNQLGIINSAAGSGLNQFKNKLVLAFSYPLARYDFGKVLLIREKDTIHPEIYFSDSLKRKVTIIHNWEESTRYKILIPDSTFFGILNNTTSDTTQMDFRTRAEKDFGNLILSMNMTGRPGQYIVQLMNEKETFVFEEKIITGSGKIRFDFMPPGKYKLKAISDRNNNHHWDTGNYRLKIQPEQVFYYPKIVEIRSNWDVEESWN